MEAFGQSCSGTIFLPIKCWLLEYYNLPVFSENMLLLQLSWLLLLSLLLDRSESEGP